MASTGVETSGLEGDILKEEAPSDEENNVKTEFADDRHWLDEEDDEREGDFLKFSASFEENSVYNPDLQDPLLVLDEPPLSTAPTTSYFEDVEFTTISRMEDTVKNVIEELTTTGRDPRACHLFYTVIDKHLKAAVEQGVIPQGDRNQYWDKFDGWARVSSSKYQCLGLLQQEPEEEVWLTPSASCAVSKREEKELQNLIRALVATSDKSGTTPLNDLQIRIQFFEFVRKFSLPDFDKYWRTLVFTRSTDHYVGRGRNSTRSQNCSKTALNEGETTVMCDSLEKQPLKEKKVSKISKTQTQQLIKLDRDEFFSNMERLIENVISSSIDSGFDPRCRHSFYLTIHQELLSGVKLNFITPDEVDSYWERYDTLAWERSKNKDLQAGLALLETTSQPGVRRRTKGTARRKVGYRKNSDNRQTRKKYEILVRDLVLSGTNVLDDLETRRTCFSQFAKTPMWEDSVNYYWCKLVYGKREDYLSYTAEKEAKDQKRKESTNKTQIMVERRKALKQKKDREKALVMAEICEREGLPLPEIPEEVHVPEDPYTAEEKERLSLEKMMYSQVVKSRLDKDAYEEKKRKHNEREKVKKAKLTELDKKVKRELNRRWRQTMTGERRERFLENIRRAVNKHHTKVKEKDPEKYAKYLANMRERVKNETPEQREKRLKYMRERDRQIRATRETPEQRAKRLARYKEYNKRKKAEMEQAKQASNTDKVSAGDVAVSAYKPREKARKPKERRDKHTVAESHHDSPQAPLLPSTNTVSYVTDPMPGRSHFLTSLEDLAEPPLDYSATTTQQHTSSTMLGHPFPYYPLQTASSTFGLQHPTPWYSVCSSANFGNFHQGNVPSIHPFHMNDRISAESARESVCDEGPCLEGDFNGSNKECSQAPSSSPNLSSPSLPSQPAVVAPHIPFTPLAPTFGVVADQFSRNDNLSRVIKLEPRTDNSVVAVQDTKTKSRSPEPKKMCDNCGIFVNRRSYERHKLHCIRPDESEAVISKCPKCDDTFKDSKSLCVHFLRYHNNSNAEDGTTKSRVVRRHGPGNSKDPGKCEQCGKHFRQKATLDDHIRRVHLGQTFTCDICGKEEQSGTKLWRHKSLKHGLVEPPPANVVQCEHCGESIFRSYDTHLRKHHPEHCPKELLYTPKKEQGDSSKTTAIKCPICSTTLQGSLKRHIRRMHGSGGDPQFRCDECGKLFMEKHRVTEHADLVHRVDDFNRKLLAKQLITSGRRVNYCRVCEGVSLASKVDIKAHFIAEHFQLFQELNSSRFSCEICPNVNFNSVNTLRQHLESTHSEKTWNCSQCQTFCVSQAEMTSHMRLHETATSKSKTCLICKERFDSQQDLSKHVKDNHSEYHWQCFFCLAFKYSESSRQFHVKLCRRNPHRDVPLTDTLPKTRIHCEKCDQVFALWSISRHMEVAHSVTEDSLQCPECPKMLRGRRNWANHVVGRHGTPIENLVKVATDDIPSGKRGRKSSKKGSGSRRPKNAGRFSKRRQLREASSEEAESNESGVDDDDEEENPVLQLRRGRGRPARNVAKKSKMKPGQDVEAVKRVVIRVVKLTDEEIQPYKQGYGPLIS